MGAGSCAFKFNVVNEQHYVLNSKLLPYAGTFCHFLEASWEMKPSIQILLATSC